MNLSKRFTVILLCALLCAPASLARQIQDQKRDPQAINTLSQDVLIIIQQEKVRFTSQKAVAEMQLKVFDQTGGMVYDSGAIAETELNWPLQDANGQAVKSGMYAYQLSIKEAGADKAQVRRGHFIVDRAQDRDGADKLWVTSQNSSGVGTELTVARDENGAIAGTTMGGRAPGRLAEGQTSGSGERGVEAESGKNTTDAKTASAAVANGAAGYLAKFTSSTDLGNSVMTELNGNVGVGISTPNHRLSIGSGPSWTTAYWGGAIEMENANAIGWKRNAAGNRFGIGQSGGGLYFFRTTSDPGTVVSQANYDLVLNDSGNVGIGTTNPTVRFHILGRPETEGTALFEPHAAKGTHHSHVHWGPTGDWYIRSAAAGGKVILQDTGGNVGIGTATPESPLHVHGTSGIFSSGSGAGLFFRNRETATPTDYWAWYSQNNIARFWRQGVGDLMSFNPNGNVGIGTSSSPSRLTIEGQDALMLRGYEPFLNLNDSNSQHFHRIQSAHGDLAFFHRYSVNGPFGIDIGPAWAPKMVIKDSGKVGIGTTSPNHQLSVARGPGWTWANWGGSIELENATAIGWKTNTAGNRFGIGHTNGGLYFFRTASDPGTMGADAIYDMSISDTGVVSVRVLEITGGADFAENFDVNVATTTSETPVKVEPGMVVSIDPTNPGKLSLSAQAYDRRVAGIISGAGGVKPGMIMSQVGTLADGKLPVALSGRVYCYVDASQGAIEPGDLLTTSATPGYAMKATDPAKAQGAIIGKAMTGLKEGKGLVLALVTLQ